VSQAGIISTSSGPVPPAVPTSFVTQNGTAVPAANILIVNAFDSTENNDNGIISKGGVVGTGTANEVDIVLTNRGTGSVTTSDATLTTIATFSLGATPGVYFIDGDFIGFDITDTAGAGYGFSSAFRTTGAAATEISTEFKDLFEEAAMAASDIFVAASGNNIVFQVQGIAAKTINWSCLFTFRFVS